MIAHCHGQLWNASQISKSLGVTAPTVKHYLSVLEETFIVRCLNPFFSDVKNRMIFVCQLISKALVPFS
ncbi:MAG: DUF4143 domain-containing protein [Candidatus Cloacimonetes bacterium]|nr:DUF4143 domain-containing protein [Candidatus Cloacimonadota bacterium]